MIELQKEEISNGNKIHEKIYIYLRESEHKGLYRNSNAIRRFLFQSR